MMVINLGKEVPKYVVEDKERAKAQDRYTQLERILD